MQVSLLADVSNVIQHYSLLLEITGFFYLLRYIPPKADAIRERLGK